MFIGREEELRLLRSAIEAPGPRIVVVHGRRRIGKTSLIRRAADGGPVMFIEGLENQGTRAQIASFMDQASRSLRMKLREAATWQEALMELHRALGRRRMVIVLDEFQWLANYRQELVSVLKMVWDNHLGRVPGRTLILCGSIASFMTTKVLRSSAFYGRTDVTIHLQGFRLAETSRLLRGRGFQEILDAQCFTGGVPKYLELLAAAPSISLGMGREAFTAGGYFVEEYERIFVSHFGRNAEYQRLVAALAASLYGLNRRELAAKAEIEEGGMLSQRLYDLEAAGFISSHRPFDKGPDSRLLRYYLSDPWISFHHAFMRRRMRKIREGGTAQLFQMVRHTGAFHSWMGRAFELVCLRHRAQIAAALGFQGVEYECGPWFRAPRKGHGGVQIDLAFDRADKVITLCEMKRQIAPLGRAVIAEVERKAGLLRAAHPGRTVQPVLVIDGPVSKEVTGAGYFHRIVQASELAV